MQLTDLPEPHKIKYAVIAALFLLVSFAALTFSYTMRWSSPPPAAAVQISLIPSIPTPPPPEPKPQETPEPEPEPEPEPDAAAAEREAEIIRAKEKEEEEKRKREQEKREEEEKREQEKREQEKREEEKKREQEKREEEKKREQEKAEEQARIKAAAAAAEAVQRALANRVTRIADKYAELTIERIKKHLNTPVGVPNDKKIVVIIDVRLNADGSLFGIPKIHKSSGSPEYDAAAFRAVLHAAPLPIPEEKFITKNEKLMRQFLEHRLYISPSL